MARPPLFTRVAARMVAVGGGAVGTVVLAGMILADVVRGRPSPPPPRNT